MTVAELIELLEGENPDAEVRFAWQPAWPMESTLADRVVPLSDRHDPDDAGMVYLAQREQLGYLPGEVSQELGWLDD